ncbi:hypothetical protein [Chitinophaga defluvii]|uniref:Pentapeptide MXKDX repeat protein n=1 Tax=Chitinophaga defluvii TaxID=3163343 RepID=A0ABV2T2F7_9BACT
MKKLGIMMTAAILFLGASAFANDVKVKQEKPEVKKEAATQTKTPKAHKMHKHHHKAKAAAPKAAPAPKA